MQLVEQHCINVSDPRFAAIDEAAFKSKNLYNAANYFVRQAFIHEGKYLGYATIFHLLKHHEAYCALPRKVSNDTLRLLDRNWKAFFKAMKAYNKDSSQFLGRPKLPKYKAKDGRNILIYDIQALSKTGLLKGNVIPSQLGIIIQTKQTNIAQVRIVSRGNHYVVEVIYEQEEKQASVDPAFVVAIDIGLNCLATLTSNKPGFIPCLVNGRPLKSINQYYHTQRAKLQSKLGTRGTSPRLERLTNKIGRAHV